MEPYKNIKDNTGNANYDMARAIFHDKLTKEQRMEIAAKIFPYRRPLVFYRACINYLSENLEQYETSRMGI